MTAWWSALAPVVWPLTCADQDHEVRWGDGVIAAPAHPDIERERALSALGADPAPCVQIVDAWNRHTDDLDVLMLGSRGAGDRLDESRPPSFGPAGHQGYASYRPLSGSGVSHMAAYTSSMAVASAKGGWRGQGMPRRYLDHEDGPVPELPLLLSLGSGLPHRLSATVIATWADRIEVGDERVAAATPALDAALYGRVRATLLPWLGAAATVQLTMQPPAAEPAIGCDSTGLRVALPFAWLRDVWANGLAVLLDRFCLHAQQTAPGVWTLATVDRDLTAPRVVTITC
jgi:hypothetical protein